MKKLSFFALFIISLIMVSLFVQREDTDSYLYKFEEDAVYKLNFSQKSMLLKSAFIPKDVTYEYEVDTLLNMKVLEKNENYIWNLFQLSSFSLDGVGVNKIILDRLTPYYQSMFLVKYSLDGKVLDYKFPGKIENFAGLLQLIYSLEVLNLEKKSYKTQEKDSIGIYDAFYKKNLNIIKKQKNRYTKVINPSENYSARVEESTIKAKIDTQYSWLKAFYLKESITLIDEQDNQFAKNRNVINLHKTDKTIDKQLKIYKEKRDVETIIAEFDSLKEKDSNIFEKISKENMKNMFLETNTTLEKLNTKLDEKLGVRNIKKYIEIFPDETYKLKQMIIDADDSTSMRIIAILPIVNSEESQKLLNELALDDKTTHIDKIRSIIALGEVSKPSTQTIDTLMQISNIRGDDLSDDKSDTSLLALSRFAKDEINKENIISYIRSEYASASSLSKEKNILLSMQNAGAENFLDEIESSLNSNSIKVKNLALKTIATIGDKNLRDKILKEQLQKENSEKSIKLIEKLLLTK